MAFKICLFIIHIISNDFTLNDVFIYLYQQPWNIIRRFILKENTVQELLQFLKDIQEKIKLF